MQDATFGAYIRILRSSRGMGQRELARNIGISAAYLSDLETDKKQAPSRDVVEKLAHALEGNLEYLFDLAGSAKTGVPYDLLELLEDNKPVLALLRAIKRVNLSRQKILEIAKSIEEEQMKAIIIAAGMGSRLKHYTEDLPKCMLEFGDKTLLQRQIFALNAAGVNEISVVKGYKADKINYPDLKYYTNPDYEDNNILNSLMYAQDEFNSPVIVSYSDILYEKEVVERLMQSKHDITIVVDIAWKKYYEGRQDHPIEEAENVILDADNNVMEIGKILTRKHDVHGEFIGMMKFSKRGAEVFGRHFNRAKELFWDKPFQRAITFQKAYITDMIQDMLDLGVNINTVIIERGWKEIDTVEDYEKAIIEFSE